MRDKVGLLIPERTYHVYNHSIGTGSQKVFNNEDNYFNFLNKYIECLSPVVDTFCYVLMPTHFHFLIRCKNEKIIEEHFLAKSKNFATLTTLSGLQKQNFRHGGLLVRPFKRTPVNDDLYLRTLVKYIHHNPVESKLCHSPEQYKHSSYSTSITDQPGFLERDKVISWFEDNKNFRFFHNQ